MQPNRKPPHLARETEYPDLWVLPSAHGSVVTSIKQSSSVRDVRDAVMTMAFFMRSGDMCARSLLVLTDSKLSANRLEQEFNRLRSVLRSEIGDQLDFLIIKTDSARWHLEHSNKFGEDPLFCAALDELLTEHRVAPTRPSSLPARQIAMSVITEMLMRSGRTESIQRIIQESGVSHPTVKAVEKDLAAKGLLHPSRHAVGMAIRPPSAQQWIALANEHAIQRKATLYCDPTGTSTPNRLASRLARLQEDGILPKTIGISGVIGAATHFANLDITSAPRLDLCSPDSADHIAAHLDAGLVRSDSDSARFLKPVLAIHLTRISNMSGTSNHAPTTAGWLDCLADLLELGFVGESHSMADHMAKQVSENLN